jgi:hypothetical protein
VGSELDPDERRVAAVVESVIAPLVERGRATLAVEPANESIGARFEIAPANAGACPVTILCDDPGDLDLLVGRHGLTTHIYRAREWACGEHAGLEVELRAWLTALVEGRYEEQVRLTAGGAAAKGRGCLQLESGPLRFTYSSLGTLGKRGPWQKVEYTAY